MSNEIEIKNKIKNNSSLFTNFVRNAVNASPKVQNNFLDVGAQVALTIKKLLEDANLITELEYKGKIFGQKIVVKLHVLLMVALIKHRLLVVHH